MPSGNQLSTSTKVIRVMNAVAAGTTDQNSSWVDMKNAESVRFIALFGTLTASQVTTVKLQGATTSNQSDAADLLDSDSGTVITTTALADGDSNKIAVIQVFKPKTRYVRCVIDRGTANAVIDGAIAEVVLRNPLPPTKDATQAVATAKGDFAYLA